MPRLSEISKGGQLAKHETSEDHSFIQRKNLSEFVSLSVSLSPSPAFVEDEAKLNLSLDLDISKGTLTEA